MSTMLRSTRTIHGDVLFLAFCLSACERSTPLRAERTDESPQRRESGAASLPLAVETTAAAASAPPAGPAPSAAPRAGECAPIAATPKVEVHNLKLSSKYRSLIKYPAPVSSAPNVDKEIVAQIEADLKRRQREFNKSADEAIAGTKDEPDGLKPDQVGLEIDCQQTFLSDTLFSIACTDVPALGGPYPDVQHFAYNFQFCANDKVRALHLPDVCRPGAACTKAIAKLINQTLKAGLAKDADVQIDAQSDALKKFAVTPKGLRFFVNEELPHVLDEAGTIDIAFGKLTAVLKADSPLAGLLAP
jgi:hypothetical protein